MLNDLLPCPWCGEPAEYLRDVWTHEAGCANEKCAVRPTAKLYRSEHSDADVRSVWNSRANV